jgi:quinol monooxygenase YgiN
MLTVIGKITARSEAIGKVRSQLTNLVEPSQKEAGCIHYSLYQDNDSSAVLFVYEKWKSKNDLDDHMQMAHFKQCFGEIEGLYDVEVHLLTEVS